MEFNNSRRRLVDLCKYTAGDWRSYETEFGLSHAPSDSTHALVGSVGRFCRKYWIAGHPQYVVVRTDVWIYSDIRLCYTLWSQVSSVLLCIASLYPYLIASRGLGGSGVFRLVRKVS